MKIIFFGSTKQSAFDELEHRIKTQINKGDIKIIQKSMYDYIVCLNNGDSLRAMRGTETIRGYKCDKAIVDSKVDEDIIQYIRYSCLCCSSELPEEDRFIRYPFGIGYTL